LDAASSADPGAPPERGKAAERPDEKERRGWKRDRGWIGRPAAVINLRCGIGDVVYAAVKEVA